MSPLSTNSIDHESAANTQLQNEYRASISPVRSRKDATEVQSEKFRYPKLSEMMQASKDITPQRKPPHPASFGETPEQTFEDEELSSDGDESSNSDEERLGPNMLKGLRKRMMFSISRQWCLADICASCHDGPKKLSSPMTLTGK